MHVYLPIAEVSVKALLLLGTGGLVGMMSDIFGVGGSFLIPPLLFFIGIPPAVTVATEANRIVTSSFSGVLTQLRQCKINIKMSTLLLIGGLIAAAFGIVVFNYVKSLDEVDILVRLCYLVFLGSIGALIFVESLRTIQRTRSVAVTKLKRKNRNRIYALPFKMRFRTSGLYISAIPPLMIGVIVRMLAAITGVGNSFIIVLTIIYILGMPTKVLVGTLLFQIIFVTAFTALLNTTTNHTVDMVSAVQLLVGGVIGMQVDTQSGARIKTEQVRIMLAIIVLMMCGKLVLDLLLAHAGLYSFAQGAAL